MKNSRDIKPKQNIKPKEGRLFSNDNFAMGKQNYLIIAAGIVLMIIGYILMAGKENIFDFRKTGLSVILVMLGFLTVGYAIMKKPKQQKKDQ